MKICLNCREEKELINFTKDSSKKDKLNNYCKICNKARKDKWDSENKERTREYGIKYNKEKRVIDKESMKEYKRQYFKTNKKIIDIKRREKYTSNKDIINIKRSENIPKRLNNTIGGLIRQYLKKNNFNKKSRTYQIINCSTIELKEYLESKFESWMTWENYGKYNGKLNYGWDIDHIIPMSSANTEDEIYKLNHYTNLQPLCSKINRDIKRDKIITNNED